MTLYRKQLIAAGIAGLLAIGTPATGLAQLSGKSEPTLSKAELEELQKKVEASPDSLNYHKEYIKAMGIKNPDLVAQYEQWMKKFPRNGNIPFALGSNLADHESPEAKPWLLKAVERNPRLAEAYMDLSIDAERWGDQAASREYMGKANAAEPSNPSYAFYYAMDFEHVDPAKWRTMLYDLAKRFPDHERGAQGLYWLAARSTDPKEKVTVYEKLRQLYPPQKFNWSNSGMSGLFDIYLESDPQKARALAQSMGNSSGWPSKDTLALNIQNVRKLMAEQKFAEASVLLNTVRLPRYSGSIELVALLKAEAAAGLGNPAMAYDSLVALHAKKPSDALYTALKKYGGKIGKGNPQIDNDTWSLREKASAPAPAFNLGLYTSDGTASLEDYKGKVVLLTFWFPGCGPCRGEFPHFENVLKKFKGQDVVYLAVNGVPEQDDYVLPFLKGTKYTFTPLRATGEWAEKTYKVRGFPTNFIIDKQGRIIFSNFMIHSTELERMLELMLGSVLAKS